MGRAGIRTGDTGFSVPEKPQVSPRKRRFDGIEIPGIALRNKGDLCRDTGAIASFIPAIEKNARAYAHRPGFSEQISNRCCSFVPFGQLRRRRLRNFRGRSRLDGHRRDFRRSRRTPDAPRTLSTARQTLINPNAPGSGATAMASDQSAANWAVAPAGRVWSPLVL